MKDGVKPRYFRPRIKVLLGVFRVEGRKALAV
jgi:hypothetical protein